MSMQNGGWAFGQSGRNRARCGAALTLAAATFAAQAVFGANGSWTGAGADTNWATAGNWDTIPGSNDPLTPNTDTALFSGTPTVIVANPDASRNIGSLSFDLPNGSFTVGANAGNALSLSNGGVLLISANTGSAATATTPGAINVAAPLVLTGATYTFQCDASTTANVGFRTTGALSAGQAGLTTLTLTGVNAAGTNQGPTQVWSLVADGSGTVGITKSGTGTWELRPGGASDTSASGTVFVTNTFSGQTVINSGFLRISGPGGSSPNSDMIVNPTGTVRFSVASNSSTNPGLHPTIKSLTINGDATGSGTLNASNANTQVIAAPVSGPGVTINYTNFSGASSPGGAIIWLRGAVDGDGGFKLINGAATGQVSWAQPIDLGNLNRPFDVADSAAAAIDLQVNGIVSGSGGIIKKGTGLMKFNNAANTFTGQLEIQGGSVTFNSSNALAGTGGVIPALLVNGGTLAVAAQSQTFSSATLNKGGISSSALGVVAAPSFAFNVGLGDTATASVILANSGTNTAALTKNGAGIAILNNSNTYTGVTTVNAGTLIAKVPAQPLILTGAGAVLNGGSLVLDYTATGAADPATTVQTILAGGVASNFTSTSLKLRTTNAANVNRAIGFSDDTTNKLVTVKYTYKGDATLDGAVGTPDFTVLATNFNGSSKTWATGDFNYDGIVNLLDFNALAINFGSTPLAGDLPSPALTSLGTLVPEPSALALATLGAGLVVRRKRRG